MPRFKVCWQSGEEYIIAPDEGTAMEDALEFVIVEAEEIEDDDEEEEEEEEEEDEPQD